MQRPRTGPNWIDCFRYSAKRSPAMEVFAPENSPSQLCHFGFRSTYQRIVWWGWWLRFKKHNQKDKNKVPHFMVQTCRFQSSFGSFRPLFNADIVTPHENWSWVTLITRAAYGKGPKTHLWFCDQAIKMIWKVPRMIQDKFLIGVHLLWDTCSSSVSAREFGYLVFLEILWVNDVYTVHPFPESCFIGI